MRQLLTLEQPLRNKLEKGITFVLLLYYLGINVPEAITQALALFSFLTIPILILPHWKRFVWVVTRDLPLLLLTAIVPISILWSTNPDATFNYSRAFLFSTAFGIYLSTRYTLKEQIQLLIYLFSIFICLNLILPLIVPSYRMDEYGWAGITKYKNDLSTIMCLITTLFLDMSIYARRYRWAALGGSSLSFLMLLLSRGKGSLGIFITIMLPLLPLYKLVKQEYRLRTLLGICTLIISGVIITAISTNFEFIIVDLLGKDTGLNGRGELWAYLIDRGLEKPWIGYGYAGFWENPAEGLGVALKFPWVGGAGQGGGNSHSSYIEVFLHLGWLGLSLVIFSLSTVLIRVVLLLGLTRQIEFFGMLQFLLFLAMASYSDSVSVGFISYRSVYWVLYVSIAYSTAIHLHRIFKTNNKYVNIQTE